MPIALYMDHHVPRAITAGLRLRGVDVLTAFEDGSIGACIRDLELLAKAGEPEDLVARIEILPL